MKNLFKSTMLVALATISLQSCKDENPMTNVTDKPAVVTPGTVDNNALDKAEAKKVMNNYIDMMHKGYKDSYDEAVKLQAKINAFVASPAATSLTDAKDAWLAAREVYGQTEVFRGSNGPIDSVGDINNEGDINAWPLDEAFIDYVATGTGGTFTSSIIADVTTVPTIDETALRGKNEEVNEASVSIGWHAIEFLLWGQDNTLPGDKLAGKREYTDYTSTKTNFERRKTYLTVVTDMLVADLEKLVETTKVGGTFRNKFLALDETVALNNIISGPCFLAANELSSERMLVCVESGEGQENEHSCFSDNTHRDVYMNAKGIVNVLKGEYAGATGDSFMTLLESKDAAQATKLKESITAMWTAIEALNEKATTGMTPFDLMIDQEVNTPAEILEGDSKLKALGNVIKESARKLGLTASDGL